MSISKRKRIHPPTGKGQSMVELAISLPILIMILIGILDSGMAIFSYSILRDAAQEGAFYGSFNPANTAEIENRTRNISPHGEDEIFSSPLDLRDKDLVQVNVKAHGQACQGITNGVTNSIEVNVLYEYKIIMPIVGPLLGSTILLKGTAINIILQPTCP